MTDLVSLLFIAMILKLHIFPYTCIYIYTHFWVKTCATFPLQWCILISSESLAMLCFSGTVVGQPFYTHEMSDCYSKVFFLLGSLPFHCLHIMNSWWYTSETQSTMFKFAQHVSGLSNLFTETCMCKSVCVHVLVFWHPHEHIIKVVKAACIQEWTLSKACITLMQW